MMNPLLLPEIRIMLAEGDAEGMAALVNDLHPASVAEFIEGLKVEEIWALLSHGDVGRQADIFSFLPEEKQQELAEGGGRERMSELLGAMSHDDRVAFLKRIDPHAVESLLPYWIKVQAALFVSDRGDVLSRLEAHHDLRITQRLLLQPRVELTLAAQDVPDADVGSGLSAAELFMMLSWVLRRAYWSAPALGRDLMNAIAWFRR